MTMPCPSSPSKKSPNASARSSSPTSIDLALAEGEALGIIGPNGAGKTTLFGIMTGTVAPDAGRVLFDGARHHAAAAAAALHHGHRALVPDSAAVRRHERVRESRRRRRLRRPAAASATSTTRCMDILERCGLADKANRRAGSLTLLDRKRLELARALATGPRVLLLDEVAGGLTEHECARPGRSHRATCGAPASRSSGSSTSCMRCSPAVDRWWCCTTARFIAEGDPHAVIRSPAVAEIYMGIEADA